MVLMVFGIAERLIGKIHAEVVSTVLLWGSMMRRRSYTACLKMVLPYRRCLWPVGQACAGVKVGSIGRWHRILSAFGTESVTAPVGYAC